MQLYGYNLYRFNMTSESHNELTWDNPVIGRCLETLTLEVGIEAQTRVRLMISQGPLEVGIEAQTRVRLMISQGLPEMPFEMEN